MDSVIRWVAPDPIYLIDDFGVYCRLATSPSPEPTSVWLLMLEDVSSSWLSTPFHIYIVVGFFIWGLFMLAFSIRRAECKHPVILAVFSFFMWASHETTLVFSWDVLG